MGADPSKRSAEKHPALRACTTGDNLSPRIQDIQFQSVAPDANVPFYLF
jgi:hypothetical protein